MTPAKPVDDNAEEPHRPILRVPVEFLTDEQAAAYGPFNEVPTHPELERSFFLDDGYRD